MSRILRCAAFVLAFTAAAPAAFAAEWTELRSANLLFIGNASERDIRQTALKLEQFREILLRVTPGLSATSPVPTVVFLFENSRAFSPYQPLRQGQRVEAVAGYFQQADTVNYIAMNAGLGSAALRVVFHEYTHFLIGNSLGNTPAWFGEGLAQVYETLEVEDGGRSAILGAALLSQVQRLQQTELIPLDRLMTVDEALSVAHSGAAQNLFYAQSWALMHYLMFGSPSRARELQDYVARLKRGETSAEAFVGAFAASARAIEQELVGYVRQVRFSARRFSFDGSVTGSATSPSRPIADPEVQAYLADLLARTGRSDEARARLQQLLEANPGNSRAAASLGWLELAAARLDLALPLLERAAAGAPGDAAIQGALGSALYRQALRPGNERSESNTQLKRAHAVLSRSVELDPGGANTLVALAKVEAVIGADLARAEQLILRAIKTAPSRLEYRIDLADVLVQQGDTARAIAQLTPLASHGSNRPVREAAAALLGRIAPSGGGSAGAAPAPSGSRPDLRVVREGERRVVGRFVRMDCAAPVVLYQIDTDGGSLRLHEVLGGAQFISHRPGTPPAFGCGTVAGTPRVLATYQPAPDAAAPGEKGTQGAGALVALEIVPDGFVPP